jgi:AcrR family transcriptional regulator
MNQIADAVQITKGNLYDYVKAEEEILFFCHHYGMGRLLELLDSISFSSYALEAKLRRLIGERTFDAR